MIKEIVLKDVERVGYSETLRKGMRLLDPISGIMQSILPVAIEQGDPLIYQFGAVTCQTERLNFNPMTTHTGGASIYQDGAIAAAIGETVERYCAAYYEPEEIIFAPYREVAEAAVPPSQFGLFSERQHRQPEFPFQRFTENTPVAWTWGYSLQNERPVLVPAGLTYLPFRINKERGDPNITYTTSTGLACGNTIEEAILSGISETVERDSLMCFWMCRLPVPHVEIDSDSAVYEVFKQKFDLSGLRYVICDVTSDLGIPSFFVFMFARSRVGQLVTPGTQADLSPTRAVLKSLVEAGQGAPYLRHVFRDNPDWQCAEDFSNIRDFTHHVRVYSKAPQHLGGLAFVTDPRPAKLLSKLEDLSTGTVRGDIEFYLSRLRKHNIDAIVVDLTTPDIEDVGLKVVRVITPGLQLMHGDHLYPFLGCARLYRVPEALGYRDGPMREDELNPYPHPMP